MYATCANFGLFKISAGPSVAFQSAFGISPSKCISTLPSKGIPLIVGFPVILDQSTSVSKSAEITKLPFSSTNVCIFLPSMILSAVKIGTSICISDNLLGVALTTNSAANSASSKSKHIELSSSTSS